MVCFPPPDKHTSWEGVLLHRAERGELAAVWGAALSPCRGSWAERGSLLPILGAWGVRGDEAPPTMYFPRDYFMFSVP